MRIVGRDAVSEFVEIGFPQKDRAGRSQLGNHNGILLRNKILKDFRSRGGANSCGVDVVLKGDGNAME